eukprot:333973-Chlamydomonas_euryale.AAC.3
MLIGLMRPSTKPTLQSVEGGVGAGQGGVGGRCGKGRGYVWRHGEVWEGNGEGRPSAPVQARARTQQERHVLTCCAVLQPPLLHAHGLPDDAALPPPPQKKDCAHSTCLMVRPFVPPTHFAHTSYLMVRRSAAPTHFAHTSSLMVRRFAAPLAPRKKKTARTRLA